MTDAEKHLLTQLGLVAAEGIINNTPPEEMDLTLRGSILQYETALERLRSELAKFEAEGQTIQ